MDMVESKFQVSVHDYRAACYYAVFLRRRSMFRAGAIVLIACFVYIVLAVNDVLVLEPLFLFVACAYLVWGLVTLTKTERQIFQYQKSPDSLLGVEYKVRFTPHTFQVEIPERDFNVAGRISDLSGAFELAACFLVYATDRQTFIIPFREMEAADITHLRRLLQNGLGEKFYSLPTRKRAEGKTER